MRDKVIEVSNLQKSYGSRQGVQGVSFTVEQGEIFGILGPNGAGKTTTVECIEGLRKPDAGEIRVLGLDPGNEQRPRMRIRSTPSCRSLRQRLKGAHHEDCHHRRKRAHRVEGRHTP
jgi:ABC-2 type transport system ATP-binding protein